MYNNNYKEYLEYIPFHFKSLADQVRHWQICEMLHYWNTFLFTVFGKHLTVDCGVKYKL